MGATIAISDPPVAAETVGEGHTPLGRYFSPLPGSRGDRCPQRARIRNNLPFPCKPGRY
jgi:hypothetical protein